jgi:hypothetical protein
MRWIEQLRMRILMLFSRRRAVGRLDDELSFHLDRQLAENISAGLSPQDARTSALPPSAIRHCSASNPAPHGTGTASNPSFAEILLLVGAIACLVPAWRASRLDPIKALRTE